MKRSLQGALLSLALLVSSRVATPATADGGVDASSSEAGAPGEVVRDAGVNDASNDASDTGSVELPPEYSPLACDGALCDTTTGETACSMSEGRTGKGGAWPFVMVLALAAIGIGRRTSQPLRRVS
jgi:hypothetical protein